MTKQLESAINWEMPENILGLLANGKSLEIQSTFVFTKPAASLLKLRTDAAQIPVSILGKMFNTNFLPLKSANVLLLKSTAVKLKSFTLEPTNGRFPMVFTALPFNVTFVILCLVNFFRILIAIGVKLIILQTKPNLLNILLRDEKY